jgi:hypothetical protein
VAGAPWIKSRLQHKNGNIIVGIEKTEVDRKEFICTLVALSQTISYKACTVISNFK